MTQRIELTIGGMTCASCAGRVEKRLNRVGGVVATVNYATERASVAFPDTLTPQDLVSVVEQAGYTARLPELAAEDDALPGLRRRLWISIGLTVPVVVLAMVGVAPWLALVLTLPVVGYGGWPFHRAAWTNLRHRTTTMDTLISLGTLAALGLSVWALLAGGDVYLETAAVVTTFVLSGRYLELRSRRRAGSAVRALLELGAKEVTLLRDGAEVRVAAAQLVVGDVFVVRPGEKVATDGTVLDGASAVDMSLVTGESVPMEVGPGDTVIGATVNAGGRLVVRATKVGADTELAQLARLVEQAQRGKAPVQRLVDRVSAVFVPVVIAAAGLTLAGWLLAGDGSTGAVSQAVTAAVAVLVIACPCALGLATPTALLVGTGRGAQLGVLIRGPEVLESTRRVDTVVLDKTGTVTTGQLCVVDTVVATGEDPAQVLRRAGAVEAGSEHPIGRAIAATAQRDGRLAAVSGFANHEGLGVTGTVEGCAVRVGRPAFVGATPPELAGVGAGATVVSVGWDGQVRGVIVVADAVKPSSRAAIAALRGLGLQPILLTGDSAEVATTIAGEVGIDNVHAGVLPAAKVSLVRDLHAAGRVVAMVGDGVNDAAAIAAADLGLAMGTGTDAAIEAADITLVRSDLTAAVDAIRLSRRTLRVIKGNLFWAFAYNVAAIPLAAAGRLNPMIAGAAMALSSVFVVSNSLRLRRFAASRAQPISSSR